MILDRQQQQHTETTWRRIAGVISDAMTLIVVAAAFAVIFGEYIQ